MFKDELKVVDGDKCKGKWVDERKGKGKGKGKGGRAHDLGQP